MAAEKLTDSQKMMIVEFLNRELAKDPPELTLARMIQLPVWTEEGYKTVPITSGQEFLIRGVRFGSRDGLLVMADPVDAQKWEYAEFSNKKFSEFFPSRALAMCRMLGAPDAATLDEAMRVFVDAQEAIELSAAAIRAKEEAELNANNEEWGMF